MFFSSKLSAQVKPHTAMKTSKPENSSSTHGRGKWGSKLQFILSCVGYAVGLGNVWRFSYLAFKNGGGAFLIPYAFSVVAAGLPLYALELALGQYSSLGPTAVFGRLAPLFQGLGWGSVIISFNISLYYNIIIAWVLFYLFASFRKNLLWEGCDHDWNTDQCASKSENERCQTQLNDTGAMFFNRTCQSSGNVSLLADVIANTTKKSPADEFYNCYVLQSCNPDLSFSTLGVMNWPMVGCLAVAWLLVFLCLCGGVQTSGKVVYFTAIFPYVGLVSLLILGLTLPGSGTGILYYIKPNLSRLADIQVWRAAAVQVFYSLGPAEGGLITLASYNDFHDDFIRDATIVTVVDSLTSTFAGLTTFSILGYMAHTLNVSSVEEVTDSGPGLAFIVFPQALSGLPAAQFWSVMFFLMLLTLGLDSQFVLYETVASTLLDQFPRLLDRKAIFVASGCVVCFLLGLPMCTQGGIYVLTIYDDYSSGYVVMMIALFQTLIVCWVYGLAFFLQDIERMRGVMLNCYWRITWAFITPAYMAFILFYTLRYYEPSMRGGVAMPESAQQFGWFLSCMPLIAILGFAIFRIVDVFRKNKPWISLITVTDKWCPAADGHASKRTPARHGDMSSRLHLIERQKESSVRKNLISPAEQTRVSNLHRRKRV